MALVVSMPVTPPPEVKLDHSAVLAAIPDAVLVVDASDTIRKRLGDLHGRHLAAVDRGDEIDGGEFETLHGRRDPGRE